jgi:hypothetical protein
MGQRVLSLMLSAWILMSAYALPRPHLHLLLFATTGLSCIVAALLAIVYDRARLANVVNAALLLLVTLVDPPPTAVAVHHDIIVSGILLILSSLGSRLAPPSPVGAATVFRNSVNE